ncbi:ABC transporter permease subunit [Streptomyces sp. 4N509B]|uniref:ABC transporter permease subunit n=1 Tax=Streptomyces sp. 4N509B TaxID=3457413 RepID=UPI003FD43832
MTTTTPYRGTVEPGGDGFGRLLLAEWTKLRTVPRWLATLLAVVVVTVAVAALAASGSGRQTENAGGTAGAPGGAGPAPDLDPWFQDRGFFQHRTLVGDGGLVTRVTAQHDSHPWAKAGLMIRADARPGAPYAAVMVTPDHGVRLQTDFTTDIAADLPTGEEALPRWLRLTREGTTVTAHHSVDGENWRRVGAVDLDGLAPSAEIGPFVASPSEVEVERRFGSESVTEQSTEGTATFDRTRLTPGGPPAEEEWNHAGDGTAAQSGDQLTLTGQGDIGPYAFADDPTRSTLNAALAGMVALVALAVLSVTAEYRWGALGATLAASPRRGRVLAAKATVVGAAGLVTGTVAGLGAFLVAAPMLRSDGVAVPSLGEGPVVRAVLGTGALLAVVAVLSLAVATVLRRAAPAIALVLLLLLVPTVVATGLPLTAATWLERLTPAAGFALQQTVERYDTAIAPWAGFGVLCGWAAVALAGAFWAIRRRDV